MTQERLGDPHAIYAGWRKEGPVRRVRLAGSDVWVVTGYQEGRAALADSRLSKAPRDAAAYSEFDRATNTHMLASDPPAHTRLRKLVTAAFTQRRIEALRPRVEEITDELLDAMEGRDRVDLIDAFAFPLPIRVITELIGIPAEDRARFRQWSNDIATHADVTGELVGQRLQETLEALVGYLRELVAYRRGNPGDDLLSGLIQVRDSGDRLSDDELTSMAMLLLVAGHETTMSLIGSGTLLLLRDRERWEELRADPGLLPGAVEEFLRMEGSVELSTGRVALEDLEIGGRTIRAGEVVMVGLLAANRDDTRFDRPDDLQFSRTNNSHLAFGHGIHHCLGAPLARLEAVIAFGGLLRRFPDLRLAVPEAGLTWRPSPVLRGLHDLPVLLR